MSKNKIRVAAVQFGVGDKVEENLETSLKMITNASKCNPSLIVLPEFINHCSWYENQDHCYSVAVEIDGYFLDEISKKASNYEIFIVVNCTVRREENKVSGTNILFGPNGNILAQSDKQVLMGNENNFLKRSETLGPIINTSIGNIGMFSCMDGVMYETPRCIALRNAQIMCNTLNSFASDEASLHIPVRAAENKVFVIASNKSGALVPDFAINDLASKLRIDPDKLNGAGESQIVDPDGNILAKAPLEGNHVIWADIDIKKADFKIRPDNTNIFKSRRPKIYKPIAKKPKRKEKYSNIENISVAVIQPDISGENFSNDIFNEIKNLSNSSVKLIVLPELFYLSKNEKISNFNKINIKTKEIISIITKALSNSDTKVVMSVVSNNSTSHEGIMISNLGIIMRQKQLHICERHKWSTSLSDQVNVLDLDWGRIGIVVGGDSIYPEVYRLLALKDVDIVAVTSKILEDWEIRYGFIERSAENRMALIVASTPSINKTSMIIAPNKDFTLWTKWERPFDGSINEPTSTIAENNFGTTIADINPSASNNRDVTLHTNVVESRPWKLLDPLIQHN
ncbi:MAG: hypothetical protein CFH01_00169 [Alphaproteobacteria bacterium MarineAlpha2_Bin1]|nr:MAG: hypothetical protein CFH01_00169 [Alphaproteobacteria bacterium MarineAlpha2_Bin1]